MQYGQTTAMSCTLAAESSDADRSDLSREIAVGCSSAPEQDASTLYVPEGFYAFPSVRVVVDARLATDLSMMKRFVRHTSAPTMTTHKYPSNQRFWTSVRRLNC
jgi:hypothetical protein